MKKTTIISMNQQHQDPLSSANLKQGSKRHQSLSPVPLKDAKANLSQQAQSDNHDWRLAKSPSCRKRVRFQTQENSREIDYEGRSFSQQRIIEQQEKSNEDFDSTKIKNASTLKNHDKKEEMNSQSSEELKGESSEESEEEEVEEQLENDKVDEEIEDQEEKGAEANEVKEVFIKQIFNRRKEHTCDEFLVNDIQKYKCVCCSRYYNHPDYVWKHLKRAHNAKECQYRLAKPIHLQVNKLKPRLRSNGSKTHKPVKKEVARNQSAKKRASKAASKKKLEKDEYDDQLEKKVEDIYQNLANNSLGKRNRRENDQDFPQHQVVKRLKDSHSEMVAPTKIGNKTSKNQKVEPPLPAPLMLHLDDEPIKSFEEAKQQKLQQMVFAMNELFQIQQQSESFKKSQRNQKILNGKLVTINTEDEASYFDVKGLQITNSSFEHYPTQASQSIKQKVLPVNDVQSYPGPIFQQKNKKQEERLGLMSVIMNQIERQDDESLLDNDKSKDNKKQHSAMIEEEKFKEQDAHNEVLPFSPDKNEILHQLWELAELMSIDIKPFGKIHYIKEEEVVYKVYPMSYLIDNSQHQNQLLTEYQIMNQAQEQGLSNILQLRRLIKDEHYLALESPRLECTLADFLKKRPLNNDMIKNILLQVLQGLNSLHNVMGFNHNNLSPYTILLGLNQKEVRLCGFENSQHMNDSTVLIEAYVQNPYKPLKKWAGLMEATSGTLIALAPSSWKYVQAKTFRDVGILPNQTNSLRNSSLNATLKRRNCYCRQ